LFRGEQALMKQSAENEWRPQRCRNAARVAVMLVLAVVLVGLACKNAILIVEYAKQMHLEGLPRHEATREACRLRLRPILMTSFAFIIGVIPLAVAFTDSSTNRPTAWSWTFGDSSTSTVQNPSHTYTTAGTYTAKLTASDGLTNATSAALGITVAAILRRSFGLPWQRVL
jgi:uncharacterized membrane protein